MNRLYLFSFFLFSIHVLSAQSKYWQQQVDYQMDIVLDVKARQFTGKQHLVYTNHSPDTLRKVFYHLYFNAFQPGSMMDERSLNLPDPDRRIGDRISKLPPEEQGYHHIESLTQNGQPVSFEVKETILEVKLNQPILPGQQVSFDMTFNSQVPQQIRRSGYMNSEGIEFSMSQWYPKMAEYDYRGWHPTPYIAREFYGVWGNYEVRITLDSAYTVAATGLIQNPEVVGKGYGQRTAEGSSEKLTWVFKAENVHDFVWTADPDYLHTTRQVPGGPKLHFFYQNDTAIIKNWEVLPEYTERCFLLMNDLVGAYPYPSYSVIQGGDGGMEYPMATLILGTGIQEGLIGVTVHESIHSWFQGVLANNESSYPWMDEGFDTYYDHIVMDSLFHEHHDFTHKGSYGSYYKLLESGDYEAISTHADRYAKNRAYGVGAYTMGCVMLGELNYIMGSEVFQNAMHRYFNTWKFKHPQPNDFMRIMEKESGMELDWFFDEFIQSTKTVDYAIGDVKKAKDSTEIFLLNEGSFPMPVDVVVTLKSGEVLYYTIPRYAMFDAKKSDRGHDMVVLPPWRWTHKNYVMKVPAKRKDIASVEIDPSQRMADVNRGNNVYPSKE